MMRPRLLPLVLIVFFVSSVLAVSRDDAYNVDYHYELLGFPQQGSTFFHRPSAASKASLLYTLSDKLVLGALNPGNGSIVWRQPLAPLVADGRTRGFLRASENSDIVVSGFKNTVRAWDSWSGKLSWECAFGDEVEIVDLEVLELEDARQSGSSRDLLLLLKGRGASLARISADTGDVKWQFEDSSGDSPYRISTSATKIFFVSLHSTILRGLQVKITELDLLDGHKIDHQILSTDGDISLAEDILYVGANNAAPIIAWTDARRKHLKIGLIGTGDVRSFDIGADGDGSTADITVHAPHRTNSLPHFLVQHQEEDAHWAEVFHIDPKRATVVKAYSLPRLAGRGVFSLSHVEANVYFTRITEAEISLVSSASHGLLGRWPLANLGADDSNGRIYPLHATSEVASQTASSFASRSAFLLSNGDWTLVQNGELKWQRHEALADVVASRFVDHQELGHSVRQLEIDGHRNMAVAYIYRLRRHLHHLQRLPAWLRQLFGQLLVPETSRRPQADSRGIQGDSYGFQKLVIVATRTGQLIALNAGDSGRILWNRKVADPPHGQRWNISEWNVDDGGQLHLQDGANGKVVLDLLTGRSVPDTAIRPETIAHTKASQGLSFDRMDGELRAWSSGNPNQTPIWTFIPPAGERLVDATARPVMDPVASIGKVLGDRQVLYKYLNPNLVLVTAINDNRHKLSVYVLDSASGTLLYSNTHIGVEPAARISCLVSENWFAYSFCATHAAGSPSQGCQLVVAELYESAIPNDRGTLGPASNYSNMRPLSTDGDPTDAYFASQSFQISEEISHMAVTVTKQGITSRLLLVTLAHSNSVVGIPRDLLNPRRPVGRDPTPQELQEGLLRYSPALDFDPKWYLNHKRELLGINTMLSRPATLESTSLLFACGLDIFGTRIHPSGPFDMLGQSFNKAQMLATVAALAVAVFAVAPVVGKKQINTRWQFV